MTIQEAAKIILEEAGRPISSKEIARIALERRLVVSSAQDPVQSHAQTIEKNIRDGVYNKPKLSFIHGPQGRLIGLPSWESVLEQPWESEARVPEYKELTARIPADLFHKIQLASQARLANTVDEMVVMLLRKGLAVVSPDIKKGLLEQLTEFDEL